MLQRDITMSEDIGCLTASLVDSVQLFTISFEKE